jgi:7,8-dihydroneopterin aldolase/epimerase/oxygenase
MFTVFLEGLEFYGYHGVPAEERVLGHRYTADLYLQVDGSADRTDHIQETVDYSKVGARTIELATEAQAHTLEHLAGHICDHLLAEYPMITKLKIRLAKPLPPCPLIAARAGVELERSR